MSKLVGSKSCNLMLGIFCCCPSFDESLKFHSWKLLRIKLMPDFFVIPSILAIIDEKWKDILYANIQ